MFQTYPALHPHTGAPVAPQKTNEQTCKEYFGSNSIWSGKLNANGGAMCDCASGFEWSSKNNLCQVVIIKTTSNQAPIPTVQFSLLLSTGSRGSDVTSLQQILIDGGFLTGTTATGYFGAMTKKAVQNYQKANGISATGTVGPLTRSKLNAPVGRN